MARYEGYTYTELGFHGRLGNQLWQIASTWAKARRDGVAFGVPHWHYREWFNVPKNWFKDEEDLVGYRNLYPDYLQDLAHIENYESDVKLSFYPSLLALTAVSSLYPGVFFASKTAVHVRRGDYLGLPEHHPACPLDYYEAALDAVDATDLVVFSDDIEWCKKQSLFKNAMFGHGSEVEDLVTMFSCGRFVISNSTFSWWAAFLADQTPEHVAYPKRWYGPRVSADYTLMVDGLGWTGIDFEDSWGIG